MIRIIKQINTEFDGTMFINPRFEYGFRCRCSMMTPKNSFSPLPAFWLRWGMMGYLHKWQQLHSQPLGSIGIPGIPAQMTTVSFTTIRQYSDWARKLCCVLIVQTHACKGRVHKEGHIKGSKKGWEGATKVKVAANGHNGSSCDRETRKRVKWRGLVRIGGGASNGAWS